ncbi:MAG: hypothetical protein RJB34_497 [Pseudomonadota bacterium]
MKSWPGLMARKTPNWSFNRSANGWPPGPVNSALSSASTAIGRGLPLTLQGRANPPPDQYCLYGKNLPDSTTFTRSPLGSGWRTMSMLKSMALMMPSPNSSWISSLMVVP